MASQWVTTGFGFSPDGSQTHDSMAVCSTAVDKVLNLSGTEEEFNISMKVFR